jgi:hypothetical protein
VAIASIVLEFPRFRQIKLISKTARTPATHSPAVTRSAFADVVRQLEPIEAMTLDYPIPVGTSGRPERNKSKEYCHAARKLTTCSNGLGDSYRYHAVRRSRAERGWGGDGESCRGDITSVREASGGGVAGS